MPINKERSLEEWKARVKAFQEANKGHCGQCGLPFAKCYHHDGTWRAERQRRGRVDIKEAVDLTKRLYGEALRKLDDTELMALPMPPTNMTKDMALKELEHRKWLTEDRKKLLTRWDRMLKGVL